MSRPTKEQLADRFAVGLTLDHFWRETMGLPMDDKRDVLARLVLVLESTGTPYALIGGVAMQLYSREPRTTIDLDIALRSYDDLPRKRLEAAGFTPDGVYEWTENWRAPGPDNIPLKHRIAVQFSAGEPCSRAVDHAEIFEMAGISVRLVSMPDLVALKLAAAEDSQRRQSKRLIDKADVVGLLEEHPELETPEIRERLERIRL